MKKMIVIITILVMICGTATAFAGDHYDHRRSHADKMTALMFGVAAGVMFDKMIHHHNPPPQHRRDVYYQPQQRHYYQPPPPRQHYHQRHGVCAQYQNDLEAFNACQRGALERQAELRRQQLDHAYHEGRRSW